MVAVTVVSEAKESTVEAATKAAPKRNCHAQHITRLCAAASVPCSLDSTLLSHVRISSCVCIHFVLFLSRFFPFVRSFVRSFFYNLKYILFSIFICSFCPTLSTQSVLLSHSLSHRKTCVVRTMKKRQEKIRST